MKDMPEKEDEEVEEVLLPLLCPYCRAKPTNLNLGTIEYACGTIGYSSNGRFNKMCGGN